MASPATRRSVRSGTGNPGFSLDPERNAVGVAAPTVFFSQQRLRAEVTAMLGTILLIILIVILIGSLPSWPYSTGWGYYPSGGIGLVLIVVLILLLMGRI